MTPTVHSDEQLDILLKTALSDDLPADVAAEMRERIAGFRAGLPDGGVRTDGRIWIFRRTVWAALAVLMLAAGFLLQGFQTPGPLSRRIAEIKAGASNAEPARPAVLEKGPVVYPGEKEA